MVKENYRGWDDTLENLPCETLKEINRLWLQNSNGNFGISIQMEIYRSQGGTSEYDDDIWKNFSLRVGWIEGYKKVINNKGKYQYASMPALIYTRRFDKGWFRNMGWGRIKHLFSRAETCEF